MQFSYDHESTRNHDSQQTFRQFPKVQSSDYLQVFQLWMVLIKSGNSRPSAIGVLRKELGVPITAIITLDDVVEYLKETGTPAQLAELEAYRKKYKATN